MLQDADKFHVSERVSDCPGVLRVAAVPGPSTRSQRVQRAFDLLVSILLLFALSPVALILALLVKTTSRGSVLFRHERIGRDGRPFEVLKFRTMRDGTQTHVWSNPESRRSYMHDQYKLVEATRHVTCVGLALRKLSLDELPQLVNVLRGEMSLVGVRPLVAPELAERSEADQRLYCTFRPGMTGIWQVQGRSTLSREERLDLDREYLTTSSLRGDLGILLRTVPAIMRVHETK